MQRQNDANRKAASDNQGHGSRANFDNLPSKFFKFGRTAKKVPHRAHAEQPQSSCEFKHIGDSPAHLWLHLMHLDFQAAVAEWAGGVIEPAVFASMRKMR